LVVGVVTGFFGGVVGATAGGGVVVAGGVVAAGAGAGAGAGGGAGSAAGVANGFENEGTPSVYTKKPRPLATTSPPPPHTIARTAAAAR
jgi:hypothetical protein